MAEFAKHPYQLPGGFLVVKTGDREILRCLCMQCRLPGGEASTTARCPQCGIHYLWAVEPFVPGHTSVGGTTAMLTAVEPPKIKTEKRRSRRMGSLLMVAPKNESVEACDRSGKPEPQCLSPAEVPLPSSASSSSDDDHGSSTSVVMRLPADHCSGAVEEERLTRDLGPLQIDISRQQALVRPEQRKSPTAVATPSAAERHPETGPEEEDAIASRRSGCLFEGRPSKFRAKFGPLDPPEGALTLKHKIKKPTLACARSLVPGNRQRASCNTSILCSPAPPLFSLEELLRAKLLPVVVEGLPGDRDIGIYPSQFPPVAPEGHVSPETEQVSSPGSASSTHLEEHDEEDYDDDDDDAAAAIDTQIQASDHEEVPIETVLPPNRPANTTYDAIVASEGKIVEAENRRHSDLMTVLERMIALQEETVSQLAHLHRVFIEVPKQLQKINTSFEALVVQQTQANYWRMTNVPQFNTSLAGSVHAGQFSPHASDIHSPGPNVTGQVADIAVQVPDDFLLLPSVQIQQLTPTKEATKRKHKQLLLTSFWSKTTKDTHETDQPSLVQCLPTCSHVSVGTSPVREQSLPKSPVAL
ncbi:uncharacterized protein LOC142492423 [Ascaphus truei]|uniref:uncharacterized protein LOC142492423 n=1 Tax=Ascaphus truei TaxID=8439 RepID=UPI003F593539